MNKQIQKLYDQADKFAKENKTQTISGPGNNYFELFHEKFAELIVRECVKHITDQQELVETNWQCKDGIHIVYSLEKHFGVEE